MLDEAAIGSAWYGLHLPREGSTAILDNNLDRLGDGAFVVAPAGQDFAVVCMISRGQLLNVPVSETEGGLVLNVPSGKKKARAFPSLSTLVEHYAQPSQSGLPCPLNPSALDGLESALPLYAQSAGLELMYEHKHSHQRAHPQARTSTRHTKANHKRAHGCGYVLVSMHASYERLCIHACSYAYARAHTHQPHTHHPLADLISTR